MSKRESFVTRPQDIKAETWGGERGSLSFYTLVSGDLTPSHGLVAGVAIVEPGGGLALHSHAQPEIYFALEGAAIVTIEAVARTVSAGSAVFIPGAARHSIHNPFDAAFKFFYVFPADRFEEIVYRFES